MLLRSLPLLRLLLLLLFDNEDWRCCHYVISVVEVVPHLVYSLALWSDGRREGESARAAAGNVHPTTLAGTGLRRHVDLVQATPVRLRVTLHTQQQQPTQRARCRSELPRVHRCHGHLCLPAVHRLVRLVLCAVCCVD